MTRGIRLHPETVSRTVESLSSILDTLCKCVYLAELMLRFYGFGPRWCLRNNFIRLDVFLVGCSTTDMILQATSHGHGQHFLNRITVVRVLRVVRVARCARMVVQLRTLWLLISGLAHSASTIFWTFILITAITYVFAIVGMEIIVPADLSTGTEFDRVATESFGTITDAMLTLLQVLTLDSIAAVYRPLVKAGSSGMQLLCGVYFLTYILFVSIALMNLVTAVMVEGSMSQAQQDKEYLKKMEDRQKAAMLPQLRQMFAALDEDGSEEITLAELLDAPVELKEQLVLFTGSDNPAEIFFLLDADDSGTLMIDEFMGGLMRATKGANIQEFQLDKIMRQVDVLTQTLLDGLDKEAASQYAAQRSSTGTTHRWSSALA
eukprot:TRINITY_DN19990_c0_g1_i12.p1 TRINITY_DN19990_c0_g1~~TRINITY_DN19990_c0_g1_i12.p1  ORF type:complete len:377 (-),score=50.25 TRINITY_DN19990_c0_g1_i12:163-1293(-)